MRRRILAVGLMSLLTACGSSQPSQPVATSEPGVLDQRMKEMQAELEQMRQQQQQMQQQQEQQRQQQLQLLYQQRQAAAAAGTAQPTTSEPGVGLNPGAPPPAQQVGPMDYLPGLQWYDPGNPKEKLDTKGNDQKL